jgi:hypothetical protein
VSGVPGTGKSFTVGHVLRALQAQAAASTSAAHVAREAGPQQAQAQAQAQRNGAGGAGGPGAKRKAGAGEQAGPSSAEAAAPVGPVFAVPLAVSVNCMALSEPSQVGGRA